MFWLCVFLVPILVMVESGVEGFPDRVIETKGFVFNFDSQQTGLAQQLVSMADREKSRISKDLSVEYSGKIRVVLASTREKMQRMMPKGARAPAWASGLAFSRQGLMILHTSQTGAGANEINKVFVHELAHILLDHAVDFRWLPRWFQEGFAIYQSGEWSFQRVRVLASGVLSGRLYSLREIEEQFPDRFSDVELAYAQSIDFVSFLLSKRDRVAFGRLTELLAKGWAFFLAVEEAYKQDLGSIESAWLHDLKVRFTWIPLVTGGAALWFLGSVILVMAYIKKRRKKSRDLKRLDEEEMWLDEEDSDEHWPGEFLH